MKERILSHGLIIDSNARFVADLVISNGIITQLNISGINSDKKNSKATYVNILGLDESIKKSKDLCESAINEIKNIKSGEIDLLIELAKYICYREK